MFSLLKRIIKGAFLRVYTWAVCQGLKYCGIGVRVLPKIHWRNKQYITIGNNCYIGENCRIEAWEESGYKPEIIFGDGTQIHSDCHIGAVNHIVIGKQCLLGRHVLIIDHAHGRTTPDELELPPVDRSLFSKGEIVIGDRVWIGENAIILPDVHIGDGSVIGAGAVVTTDLPPKSVAVGNPARIIKKDVY